MGEIKNNQHYAWKHYLKPWTTEGMIWCGRKDNIWRKALKHVGKEILFYEAEPLNSAEKDFIERMISMLHPTAQPIYRAMYEIYNKGAEGTEVERKNTIENYHSFIEGSMLSVLEQIYNENLSFLHDERKEIFAHFLGLQYTRTKKIFDRMVGGFDMSNCPPEYQGKLDQRKLTKVLHLFSADAIGNWISSAPFFTILQNNSDTAFITGDQPIFNLLAASNQQRNETIGMELYYPISPTKALLISMEERKDSEVMLAMVEKLNLFIVKSSGELIFGNSKEILMKYKKN